MLEDQLRQYFGFTQFKAGQREVMQKLLERQSAAAIFPTGSGKSLCYQLPAMLLPAMTLVVSPLLALMKDQIDFLLARGIPCARLDSTLSATQYSEIVNQAAQGRLKILMISVERFRNERFRHSLKKMRISLLVIDEAHCISEWGHNFRPEYLKLPFYQKEFAIDQVLLLTATATHRVIEDMCEKFRVVRENVVITGFYRPNLFLRVTQVAEVDKPALLLRKMADAPTAPTIVYVTLQKTAEHVSDFLRENGVQAHHYHAGMENEERERIQNRFMAGQLDCVVATIAFGMGIDKKDIRRVFHYDMPKSVESYSQEIGRSGRDGEHSLCELLANRDKINILENFVYGDTPEKNSICELLRRIRGTDVWEVKWTALSNEIDMRILPLKTLLVYLEMDGIVRPKYTYFEDYSFRYVLRPHEIAVRFQGERRSFVEALFRCSLEKKIWCSVDMAQITASYGGDRERVLKALEYFDENGWIELRAQQAIDVYEIVDRGFSVEETGERMFRLFLDKEGHEIRRIHGMIDFFESDSCLSRSLAGYFGEHLERTKCGHCSWCESGRAIIRHTEKLPPLSSFDFADLTSEFLQAAGKFGSARSAAKFLCGIYTPAFLKIKAKKMPNFGFLENHPFLEVKNRMDMFLPTDSPEVLYAPRPYDMKTSEGALMRPPETSPVPPRLPARLPEHPGDGIRPRFSGG